MACRNGGIAPARSFDQEDNRIKVVLKPNAAAGRDVIVPCENARLAHAASSSRYPCW
jgi:hypothetical protein